MAEKGQEDSCQFVRQQKAALKDYLRKQASLMAKPREVKRLSDLILLELKVKPPWITPFPLSFADDNFDLLDCWTNF